jgi:hypothetical protein
MSDVIVEAPVTQVVTGSVLSSGEGYPCCRYGRLLRDGDSVVVYACRCAEATVWRVPRVLFGVWPRNDCDTDAGRS